MAVIDITTDVNDDDWARAIDALAGRVAAITPEASSAAAEAIQVATRGRLLALGHPALTFSPAPPGASPANVSGDLAASIATAQWGTMGAMVGPTAGFGRSGDYARIQELSGPMNGHPFMVFHKTFRGAYTEFKLRHVDLAARSYLRPATEQQVNSGRVRDIYSDYWATAIEG